MINESSSDKPKRILHVLGALEYGGVPMMLLNFYRHLDRGRFQFDFLHYGGFAPYHAEIEAMGGRIFRIRASAQQACSAI